MRGMKIEPNSKLLFIGDSITDIGRARPIGEAPGGLGDGYVSLVEAALLALCPERRIRVVNVGSGGNTVRDLAARWETDVLQQKPDWLSILIGINDVWRQYDRPLLKEQSVFLDEYQTTLDKLVRNTKPLLKGLVLMTPYYIEPNPADAMRATMDKYGQVVKKLAAKYAAICVDTQAAFNRVLKTVYPGELAWDRVHPVRGGHMLLASEFLKAVELGCC